MSCPILQAPTRKPTRSPDYTSRARILLLVLLSLFTGTTHAQVQPLEREIGGGDIHSYRLTLSEGQFVTTLFDQRGIDILVLLLDAQGRELQRVDNPATGSWGTEALFFEVATSGHYFVQVRPRRPSLAPGRYVFEIDSRRAGSGATNTFAAERAFAEATQLMNASAVNHQSALARYEEALRLFRARGDRRGEVLTLTILAFTHASVGEEQRALPFFDEAMRLQSAAADLKGEALTRSAAARARLALGDKERALEQLTAARKLFQLAGDKRMVAYTFVNTGAVHDSMGEPRQALANYERALPLFREAGDRQGEASTLNNIGLAYDAIGETKKARVSYEQAVALFRNTGQCNALAPALSNVAFDALATGDRLKAVAYLEEALAIQRNSHDREGEARTLNNLGFVYNSLGEREKALTHLGQALSINRAVANREGEGDSFSNLMFSWRAANRPQAAIFYGKQAVNAYQEIRREKASLDREAQRNFIRSRESTYQQLADLLIARDRLLEAQQILGLLKEEEYFQYVRRDGREAASLDGRAALNSFESDFERRYRDISESLPKLARERSLLEAKKPNLTAEESLRLDQINADLNVAEQAFQQFINQMSNEMAGAPRRTDLPLPGEETEGIIEDLKQLGAGVAAVYTSVGEDKYRVILFTRNLKVGREYPIKAAELYRKVFAFRQALEDPRADPRPLAQELYRILVGPVASMLKGEQIETIMWSLSGPLRYVPVAALHDGEDYLVARYRNAVFTPVSTSHLTDAPGTGWKGLGVGVSKPQKNFAALPEVPRELHNIFREEGAAADTQGIMAGKVLLDESFTEETFFSQLSEKYPVVHIASHFQFRPGNVRDSFLLLGNGEQLSLARIKATPHIFSGVELLALSACETATTEAGADGKEVEGFAVLAQQRGAKAVLASLWPVADKSTTLLMEKFYQTRSARPGTSKAEA
ncbi:MAG TPA: CHAT domain-containing protein, partial [Pyrinomonadaceae bacterium]|nr:CHAT domain-containing protein [Pyrinomonadaceae bacterium]